MLELSSPDATAEARALLDWYDRARRDLPWRAPPGVRADPYAVWLSEIMLQQTTVAAVKPYFAAFLARWPDVAGLAAAPLEEVLAAWAGLGYYSRARNLHACARQVVEDFGSRFPEDETALRRLPGIGAYTAAAIASIAHGRRATVVDGNVERVITRYFAIRSPLPGARPEIRARADSLTPALRPGDYAQAMMDLGATICTPRSPACPGCPLSAGCRAHALGIAADLPQKAPRTERPIRRGAIFVLRRADGAILAETRPPRGLLGGMPGLPGTDWRDGAPATERPEGAPLAAGWRNAGGIVHVFTHFRLELTVFAATCGMDRLAPGGLIWLPPGRGSRASLPTVMKKALDRGLAALD